MTRKAYLPTYKPKAEGSWAGETQITNLKFYDFGSTTTICGAAQHVFKLNPFASDYVPLHKFDSITFTNVAEEALVYLDDAPQEWATAKDCGTFTCTGPANVLMSFEQTIFISTNGLSLPFFFTSNSPISYQISSKNREFANSRF